MIGFVNMKRIDINIKSHNKMAENKKKLVKLNLGCGSQVVDGWINVDYALGARLMKIPFFKALNRKVKLFNLDWNEKIYLHNLTNNFPWDNDSIDVVYSSHTLEHFTKEEGRKFLKESHRVLRKKGIFRIVVPDLQKDINQYIKGEIYADDFIQNLGVLYGNKKTGILKKLSPFIEFPHKCMYDNTRLIQILNDIGFEATTRFKFESDIEDIYQIELATRVENAVIIEGLKY